MTTSSTPTAAAASTFQELPLGAVRPLGWLREQLALQASGLTGQLEAIWPDVGPDSAWLGGSGEGWERGPYYVDGLLPLAYILQDPALIAKANTWVEAMLASQRPDGFFGPSSNDDWWPRMVALKILIQHFEATGDERIEPFLERYFQHQARELPVRPLSDWGEARGAENALSVLWLHQRTPADWLLELARTISEQTLDWETYLTDRLIRGPASHFDHATHVVNVAMGLKYFAVRHLLGFPGQRELVHQALANLDTFHGMPNGMFSGDEWLAGLGPQRGVETCAVVEAMYSLEILSRSFGDGLLADRLEVVAFNALAAAMSADLCAHQYHQQVNQISASVARREWTFSSDDANIFGLEPHFGCCTANLHQGWPKFVRSLWAALPSHSTPSQSETPGVVALAYAPNLLDIALGGGRLRIETVTNYPFGETLMLQIHEAPTSAVTLKLRVPAWCQGAVLTLDGVKGSGEPQDVQPDADGFVTLSRVWQAGESLSLTLPMPPRLLPRPNAAVSLMSGPLLLAFSPGEIWQRLPGSAQYFSEQYPSSQQPSLKHLASQAGALDLSETGFGDWEARARHSWNFGLDLTGIDVSALPVERFGPTSPPFTVDGARPPVDCTRVPLKVFVSGYLLPEWDVQAGFASAAPPPAGPIPTSIPVHHLPLIPYGCARVRIAEFPQAQVVEPA